MFSLGKENNSLVQQLIQALVQGMEIGNIMYRIKIWKENKMEYNCAQRLKRMSAHKKVEGILEGNGQA